MSERVSVVARRLPFYGQPFVEGSPSDPSPRPPT